MTCHSDEREGALVPYTLCYLRHDDEVLFLAKTRGSFEGYLNAPGGRVEPGETPVDCIVREFAEETGLELHLDSLTPVGELVVHTDDSDTVLVHLFRASGFDGSLLADEAAPDGPPRWVAVDDLVFDGPVSEEYHLPPGDEYFIPLVFADSTFRCTLSRSGGDTELECVETDVDLLPVDTRHTGLGDLT